MKSPLNIAKFGFLMIAFCGSAVAEGDLSNEAAPKAVPVEDLMPKFDGKGVVISRTGQFKVSGSDMATRAAAANLAEEGKDGFLKLIEERDEWKIPVMVELRGELGEAVPLRSVVMDLTYNETGYQVKIFVNLSRGLQKEPFQRAVIASCVLARTLKDYPKSDAQIRHAVPPWLVEGLAESVAWSLGLSNRRLYDALFKHDGLFALDHLFGVDEAGYMALDAASKAAFRVSAGALVMALHEQPEGKAGMRAFLKVITTYDGEVPGLLRQHFSELNLSQSSLEKWWALQLASKGSAPLSEVLGVAQTELALEQALKFRYRDEEGVVHELPVAEWKQVPELSKAERAEAVRLAEEELVRLSYRCFPSFRPLLKEYQIFFSRWIEGKNESLSQTLLELEETREIMVGKAERGRDFLDWFEITRARETSGVFDDYLNLKSRLKSQPNQRTDSISKCLDLLDPLFALPEQRKPGLFLPTDF